jgi:hypothetical protein
MRHDNLSFMPRDDLVGRTFNRLTVKAFVGYPRSGKAQWRCDCSCGATDILVLGYRLKDGTTGSCGCWKIEATKRANSTHKMSRTKEYGVYCTMIARCYSPTAQRYELYGGRGIRVCKAWRGSSGFLQFLKDMGKKPTSKHSVERIDNDGNYSPSNCRWATQKEQCRNRRDSRRVRYEGKTWTVKELCEHYKIAYARTIWRLNEGWSVRKTVLSPNLR